MRITHAVLTSILLFAASSATAYSSELSWAKSTDGGTAVALDVASDDDGNVYIVGFFQNTIDFNPGPGIFNLTSSTAYINDAFLLKLGKNGRFKWAKKFGGAASLKATSVDVTPVYGEVYVGGLFEGAVDFDPGTAAYNLSARGTHDGFMVNLSRWGQFRWARRMGGPVVNPSVSSTDAVLEVAAISQGTAVVIGGYFEGTADIGPFNLTTSAIKAVFISLVDRYGNFVWAKHIASNAWYPSIDTILARQLSETVVVGTFALTGDFDPGPGTHYLTSQSNSQDGYIAKYDSLGNLVWARGIGGPANDLGTGVGRDSQSNLYMSGSFSGTVDFDPGPSVFELIATPSTNAYVMKLDTNGTFTWALALGEGAGISRYDNHLLVDSDDSIHIIGNFSGTGDFDPGEGVHNLTWTPSSRDIYAATLSSNGEFLWAGSMLGSGFANFYGVALAPDGVLGTGNFSPPLDIDPGPGTVELSGGGAYVFKLGNCSEATQDEHTYGLMLFPPKCTRDATALVEDVYASRSIRIGTRPGEAYYLSSSCISFSDLVVDDAIHINGLGAGLGPYTFQEGVPPFLHDVPIERNLVPLPTHEVTTLLPSAPSEVQFDLLDTQREIYGNTPVCLLRDCGMWLEQGTSGTTQLTWVSHEVDANGAQSDLSVVSGLLSHMSSDAGFVRACNLGSFLATTKVQDLRIDPPLGDGYYYLIDGTCGTALGYGYSSTGLRTGLPPATACP